MTSLAPRPVLRTYERTLPRLKYKDILTRSRKCCLDCPPLAADEPAAIAMLLKMMDNEYQKRGKHKNLDRLYINLDFTFNRLCMKVFKTGSIDIVKDCLNCFALDLPSCVCKKKAR